MAESIRERIVDHVVRALSAAGKPERLSVHRFRTRPVPEDELPATVVYLGGWSDRDEDESADADHDDAVERTLLLTLEHRTQGNPPDKLLSPLISWAVRALMADPTCGGLATKLDEMGLAWDAAQAAHTYGAAQHVWRVVYYTKKSDDTELPE